MLGFGSNSRVIYYQLGEGYHLAAVVMVRGVHSRKSEVTILYAGFFSKNRHTVGKFNFLVQKLQAKPL